MDQYIQGNFFENALRGHGGMVTSGSAALTIVGTITTVAGAATVHATGIVSAPATEIARAAETIIQYVPVRPETALEVVLKVSGVIGLGQNAEWAYHHVVQIAHFVAPLVSDFAKYAYKIAERTF